VERGEKPDKHAGGTAQRKAGVLSNRCSVFLCCFAHERTPCSARRRKRTVSVCRVSKRAKRGRFAYFALMRSCGLARKNHGKAEATSSLRARKLLNRRCVHLRACFKINESRQTVFKVFCPTSSRIFRRSRRILLPEPPNTHPSAVTGRWQSWLAVCRAQICIFGSRLGGVRSASNR
jgi:hypothetical protein